MKIAMVMMPAWNVEAPPIATAYLSTYLGEKGYEVSVFDFNIDLYKNTPIDKRYLFDGNQFSSWLPENNFNNIILKKLNITEFIKIWADKIIDYGIDIVCFSTYYSNYLSSMMLAGQIKKRDKKKIVIFGGPEASRHENGYVFIEKDYIDVVIIGEGELTLDTVIKAIQDKGDISKVKGILYYKEDKLYDNQDGMIEDINKIPPPTFGGFNISDYTRKILPILTSRGCINYCKFCGAKPLWNKYRYRNADSIFKEIRYLKDRYGINKFDIIDALINGNIKELNKLCDLFIDAKIDINWGGKAIIRPEMDRRFLRKMYDAGCRWLSYGIESGSQEVIKAMGKDFDIQLAHRALKDTHSLKINVATFFIIGYPAETRLDFLKTLWFIIRNRRYIGSVSSGQKCGIPGNSILFRNASRYGIRFEKDGWYSPNNTPKERELRHKLFKIATRFISLKVLHA